MKVGVSAALFLAGSVSAHYLKDPCFKGIGPCTVPPPVAIPQINSLSYGKPIFHKHGLIQVQLPPQQRPLLAPSAITSTAQFAVGTPKLGKVVDRTEPTYFCKKPGYVLEGSECVFSAVEPARLTCPGGYDAYDDGCVRRASFLQHCPAGYTRRDGNCAKLVSASFLQRCPEGTLDAGNGICQRQVPHPLTPTCPEGTYEARTGSCAVTVMAEARAFCPEGFSYTDGACLQEEVYDCSHSPVGLATVPQLGLLQTTPLHQHVKGRMLTHVKQPHTTHVHMAQPQLLQQPQLIQQLPQPQLIQQAPITIQKTNPCEPIPTVGVVAIAQRAAPPCEVAPPAPQVIVQPTKTTITMQKTCTRVTSTALVFACEDGILQGQRCLIKQAVAPIPVCHAQGDATNCFALAAVAPIQECPMDYSRECLPGRQCQCVALEAAAFISSCPSGFEADGEACTRLAQARAVCSEGFVLQGDQCVRLLREPADCVFSVTYECDHTTGLNCQNVPPALPTSVGAPFAPF